MVYLCAASVYGNSSYGGDDILHSCIRVMHEISSCLDQSNAQTFVVAGIHGAVQ